MQLQNEYINIYNFVKEQATQSDRKYELMLDLLAAATLLDC